MDSNFHHYEHAYYHRDAHTHEHTYNHADPNPYEHFDEDCDGDKDPLKDARPIRHASAYCD